MEEMAEMFNKAVEYYGDLTFCDLVLVICLLLSCGGLVVAILGFALMAADFGG